MTASGGKNVRSNRDREYLRLLGQHDLALTAFVHKIVPSWHDAEEILQETKIRLWEQFDRYQPDSDFCAWACVVAHYFAKTYFKRRQPAPAVKRRRGSGDPGDDNQNALEADRRLAALAECMRKLGKESIAFLRRCYVEKEQIKEIAAASGRSLPGAYAALSRIRRGLLSCVQNRLREEDGR